MNPCVCNNFKPSKEYGKQHQCRNCGNWRASFFKKKVRNPIRRTVRAKKQPVAKSKRVNKATALKRAKKRLWELTKAIVRARYVRPDGTWTCYTCGRLIDTPSKAQTGHCIPSATGGVLLRYDLRNLRIQDYYCNINLGGNGAIFIENLREEMGNAEVDDLLSLFNQTQKADLPYFEKKIAEYEALL